MEKEDLYINPPQWLFRMIRPLLKEGYIEEVEGDMYERFCDNLETYHLSKANRLYLLDTIKLLKPTLIKRLGGDSQINHYGMLSNNMKVAWRQMLKQKIFSGIKVGGFAISLSACLLISLYIGNQISYDQHYNNGDNIFRLINQWSESGEVGYWANVHGPLKKELEANIPEIKHVARIVRWPWRDAGVNHIRSVETTYNRYEEGFFYADPELLEILEIPMVYGTRKEALRAPNSMVISKAKAQIYFPNQDPVGQRMILNDNPKSTFVIGGVMDDFPSTSHLQGDFILTLFERKEGPGTSGWCCTNYNMYTQLIDGADKLAVEKKTGDLRNSLIIEKLRQNGQSGLDEMAQYQSYYLQPVRDIYLNPEEVGDDFLHGSIELVGTFGAIAIIILLLACINFVNLSTAQSLAKMKELGLRKVMGSYRSGLIYQYLTESCLYTFLAILMGLVMSWAALPFFNQLAGTALVIPWFSVWFLPAVISFSFFIGLLAGMYPALVLSSFHPIEALRGQAKSSRTSFLQSGMVVFQFTATVVLIIGALLTHQQFQFLMEKPIGYDKDQVINVLGLNTLALSEKEAFKSELLKVSSIKNATLSDFLPVEGGMVQNRDYWPAGKKGVDIGFEAARWVIDEDYLATMQIELAQGRNFRSGEGESSIIINEDMAKALHLTEVIGQQVVDMFDERHTIIGVVKDFYFESLLGEVRPLVMVFGNAQTTVSVKFQEKEAGGAIEEITKVWDIFSPNQEIRYTFMDQRFERMYANLGRAKTIFLIFAFLSIVVACLGLFALSIHLIKKRGKEMSVRKVLGASFIRIFKTLTFDFLKLVLLAIVIAVPIAWYFANEALENVENRITLSWDLFAIAGVVATFIAIGTISFEAIKAALVNPAERLKNE